MMLKRLLLEKDTISIVLFLWMSGLHGVEAANCETPGEGISVVPVCTSSTQSGQTLYIDTSAVQSLVVEQTCQCDVTFMANATTVGIRYFAPDYPSCGLKFSFPTTSFLCTSGFYSIEPYFEKITFTRDAISQATACLVIYLDKNTESTASATVNCHESGTSSSTSSMSTTASTKTSSTTESQGETDETTSKASLPGEGGSTLDLTITELPTDDKENGTSIGVIVGASVGGLAVILGIVVVTCIMCFRRQKRTKATVQKKPEYINPVHEPEMTYNALYKLDMPDEANSIKVQPNDTDGTYTTVDNNESINEKPITITNSEEKYDYIGLDDSGGLYNTINETNSKEDYFDKNKDTHPIQDTNMDVYNVPDDDNTESPETEENRPVVPGGQEADVTYAVVNKNKNGDTENNVISLSTFRS